MKILPLLCAFSAALSVVCFAAAEGATKPNVILIFTDDHGWADLGAQGIRKDIRTPHLDALAAGGVRATNGYITAAVAIRAPKGGTVGLSWRLDGQADFLPTQIAQAEVFASDDFQNVAIPFAADGTIIHLRVRLPAGATELRQLSVKAAKGPHARVWSFASVP